MFICGSTNTWMCKQAQVKARTEIFGADQNIGPGGPIVLENFGPIGPADQNFRDNTFSMYYLHVQFWN